MSDGNETPDLPREAFALLGHDLRLEILLALLDRWRAAKTEPQRYADLMRAVGLEDSGKLNYHLKKLRGAYLRKTDEGYVPTASATALSRAVLANRPTAGAIQRDVNPDVACSDCGERLAATYERAFLTVECEACESDRCTFTYPLPKNGLGGRTDEACLRTVYRRARSQIGLARTGQCPDCAGRTSVTVRRDNLDMDSERAVRITCDTCTWMVQTGVLLPVLSDGRVAAALVEVGLSVETAYHWDLPAPTTTVHATDPLEIKMHVEGEDGTATVLVDEDLKVVSVENGPNELADP